MGIHWKIQFLGGCSQKNNIDGWGCLKRRVWVVCRFKGGARKSGVVILRGKVDTQRTLCSRFTHTFLTVLSFFLSTKISFSHFFFVMKYQIFTTEYWSFKNQNRWSEIVCRTVCVIVVWLTSDEWVYVFVSCPNFILINGFKSNWWALQGFGTYLTARLQVTHWLN